MANPWFRMYHEFATDPKVQMLSEADQRRFIMLLCLRCCNDGETLHDEEIAFQLRVSNEEFAKTKQLLIDKGLINEDCIPTAWDKRQFASDSSTARVKAYRERNKRDKKQDGNVSVTAPDTDTDTDTDTEKKSAGAKSSTKKTDLDYSSWPEMPEAQTLKDWFEMRKDKKAKVTQTVINQTAKDLEKAVAAGFTVDRYLAEWIQSGWQGFKFDWFVNRVNGEKPAQAASSKAPGQPPNLMERMRQQEEQTARERAAEAAQRHG